MLRNFNAYIPKLMLKAVTLPSEGWYLPAVLLSVTTQKTTTQERGKFISPPFIIFYLVVNSLIRKNIPCIILYPQIWA